MRTLLCLTSAIALVSLSGCSSSQNLQSRIDSLTEKVDSLSAKVSSLQDKGSLDKSSYEKLMSMVKEANYQADKANKRLDNLVDSYKK